MAGQSPYVANLSLGYSPADTGLSLNLFYNVFGRRIAEVGLLGMPDVYEEPFHSLDFTASYQLGEHWMLGLSATNLLFQQLVIDQGGFDISRIDKGATFALRLGFVKLGIVRKDRGMEKLQNNSRIVLALAMALGPIGCGDDDEEPTRPTR